MSAHSLLLPSTYSTRVQLVAEAVIGVLGQVSEIGHELLTAGVGVLQVVGPVLPGLEQAAKTLLYVWNSLRDISVSVALRRSALTATECVILSLADKPIIVPQPYQEMRDHPGLNM